MPRSHSKSVSKSKSKSKSKSRSRSGSSHSRSSSRSRSSRSRSRSRTRSRTRSRSRSYRSGGGGGGGGGYPNFADGPPGSRLHVGDLGPDPSKTELERAFSKFGRIREVFISNTIPHFAFVQFESRDDASEALKEMNGKTVNGARIRVSPARPRREDRFGGGPPRGGPGGPCFACGEFGHFARECPRDRRGGDRFAPAHSNGGSRGSNSASFGRNCFTSNKRSDSRSYSRSRSRSRSDDRRRSKHH